MVHIHDYVPLSVSVAVCVCVYIYTYALTLLCLFYISSNSLCRCWIGDWGQLRSEGSSRPWLHRARRRGSKFDSGLRVFVVNAAARHPTIRKTSALSPQIEKGFWYVVWSLRMELAKADGGGRNDSKRLCCSLRQSLNPK